MEEKMTKLEAREKARQTVQQMDLEEKVSQTLYQSPAIERLGIPAYNWWNEALHGVARAGLSTVFPQSIGLAATFNKEVLRQVGQVIGEEGRIKNRIYRSEDDRSIYKGLTYWSPNINIVRDPRWGRAHESYGEDPCLNAAMGTEFVKGIQGDGEGLQAAACAKHFAVHSGPEAIRHGFNAETSEKDLRETYLPAFERLVKDAKVAGVMSSYNAVNGVPSSANNYLMRTILRDEWGFEGYTVSDCGAISDIYDFLHYTDTKTEAAAEAMKGGCNLNCGTMYAYLLDALRKGLLQESVLDEALENLFTIRYMLDMDEPVKDASHEMAIWLEKQKEWDQLNEKIAGESLVLLKNDGLLPLSTEKTKTIAVIGPNADSREVLKGNYNGTAGETVTLLQGIRREFPMADVLYSEGSHLYRDRVEGCSPLPDDRVSEAKAYASFADVTILALGLDHSIEGEQGDASNEYAAGDKRDVTLPESQKHLLKAVCEVSDNVIVVLLSGGCLDLGEETDKVRAILQGWYPGALGGLALAGAISGRVNPTGRLPVTFYRAEQVSWDFVDYAMEGKTYRFFQGKPGFPFGFGLDYRHLTMIDAEKKDHSIQVTLKNEHEQPVSMALQVYAKAEEEGLRTPNFQLAAIEKPTLEAGETRTVEIKLDDYWLMVVDETGTRRPCRGSLSLYVGDHQPDERSEELAKALGRQPVIKL